ncbi:Polyribonucleotide nucleotidyltransferase [Pseudomonas sp. 8Z]|uniref:polyribonucleotide nucleotidyltransferase n=1 Tax=Pseudomonas sp. 8Z TaxID=2653166 RepID=UPI0012F10345|nr:polyribonucleotide nucleotidyltransferase [Pseudomonas sp. 8Z]VXC27143.1 Polyribonucleotide nucleotidyltransferase [Pseudomonas sp. 8Z]
MSTRSRVIAGVVAATLLTQLSACGTIFYPDRRGQIEGKVDPVIVAADAIGILFFVIPGLIAFAVDFATGAIYLPEGKTAQVDPQQLKQVIGADGKVDQLALKQLIETSSGQQLPLDDPRLIQHSGSAEQLAAYGLRPAA